MSKKVKRFTLLFRNDKFLIVLSLVIAIATWLTMSFSSEEGTVVTVSDIPITVDLSDEAIADGLQTVNDLGTVSVTVQGNKVTVGSLTKSDIQVVAQNTSSIVSPGSYNLDLVAKKTGMKSDYEIISCNPSSVTVTVDRHRSAEFKVVDNLVYEVEKGYYATTVLDVDKVTISGAEASISKIDHIAINGTLDGVLNESQTLTCSIILYDDYGEEIKPPYINLSQNEITATVTVLPEKTVSIEPKLVNQPLGLAIDSKYMKLTPSEIQVAGPKAQLDTLDTIQLDDLDFRQVGNKLNVFNFDIKLPADCRNLSNVSTVKVELDFSTFKLKELEITKFTNSGLESGYESDTTTKSLKVKVIGPENQINTITANDLSAKIDFSKKIDGFVGSTEMPVIIQPSASFSNCWIYDEYKANVVISKTS